MEFISCHDQWDIWWAPPVVIQGPGLFLSLSPPALAPLRPLFSARKRRDRGKAGSQPLGPSPPLPGTGRNPLQFKPDGQLRPWPHLPPPTSFPGGLRHGKGQKSSWDYCVPPGQWWRAEGPEARWRWDCKDRVLETLEKFTHGCPEPCLENSDQSHDPRGTRGGAQS